MAVVRAFLDHLYGELHEAREEITALRAINNFSANGSDADVHRETLKRATERVNRAGACIDAYVQAHRS